MLATDSHSLLCWLNSNSQIKQLGCPSNSGHLSLLVIGEDMVGGFQSVITQHVSSENSRGHSVTIAGSISYSFFNSSTMSEGLGRSPNVFALRAYRMTPVLSMMKVAGRLLNSVWIRIWKATP